MKPNWPGYKNRTVAAAFKPLGLAVLLVGLTAPFASAATFIWTGATNVNWGISANWNPSGTFPTAGNASTTLQFNSSSTAYSANDNVVSYTLNKIVYEQGTGNADISTNLNQSNQLLNFVANGGVNPSIVQNSGSTVSITASGATNQIALANDLSVTGVGSGLIRISAIIQGAGGITLNNSNGTLLLSGANTYTGGTTLTAGTLQVGSATVASLGTGTLSLNGGTISSMDSIGKTVSNAVNVGAGAGVTLGNVTNKGMLTFTGATTIGAGATLTAVSNVTFTNAVATGDNLKLVLNGGAIMTLPSLDVSHGVTFDLTLGNSAPLALAGALTNADAALLNFNLMGGSAGQVYTLITFGSTTLTYAELNLLSSTYALDTSFGTDGWLINGNNIQVQLVPEPAAGDMLMLGLCVFGAVVCLRRIKCSSGSRQEVALKP